MKTVQDKIERIKEIKNEIKGIKKDLKVDMFDFVMGELKERGFIIDPRGAGYERSLYNPETKFSVRIGGITELSVSMNIHLMDKDGMEYHSRSSELSTGAILFNFTKKSFDKFFNGPLTNYIKKINMKLVSTPIITKVGNYSYINYV